MKYLSLFIIPFLIGCLHASQKASNGITVDSLKKYSYHISGVYYENGLGWPYGGTVFFIRKNSKTYLITAKHVLSGCDSGWVKNKKWPEVMIVIFKSHNYATGNFPIRISAIKDTAACLPFNVDADVITVEINDSNVSKVYSVEDFLLPPFKHTSNVEMFGFPAGNSGLESIESFSNMVTSHTSLNPRYTEFQSYEKDSINYFIKDSTMKLTLKSQKGYSGAPVFVKDSLTNQWRVVGVYAGLAVDTLTGSKKLIVPNISNATSRLH